MTRCHRRVAVLTVVLATGVATAGCGHTGGDRVTGGHATYTYTCCTAKDVATVRHPGDVVLVHWIVSAEPPSASPHAVPVTLTAALRGPYRTVTRLKDTIESAPATPVVRAAPVRTSDQTGGSPVSRLVIPSDAGSGFYDLATSTTYAGGVNSGDSIIQVATK